MSIIQCAAVFTDHCVLQRGKPIRIWGVAPENTQVQISLNGFETAVKSRGHDWLATLPPMEAGGPYTLTVRGEDQAVQEIRDVMIGEVWLAGGQSNMEYPLGNDAQAGEALGRAARSGVRFYQVSREPYLDDYFYAAERQSRWMCPGDPQTDSWSAVGYYFAEALAERLGVTVGVIGCNLGGTSASAWMDRESLCAREDTAVYWKEYEEIVRAQDPEQYEKERLAYLDWHADWQPRMDAYYQAHPQASWEEAQAAVGVSKWPGPMGPRHEFRPCGLYETMLRRVSPYTLAGFLFYQGEADEIHPHSYYHLLESLIRVWRRDFQEAELPFLNVQLPMHRYAGDAPSDRWCIIRQAQLQIYRDVPRTGLAVAIDCGEYNNIHPTHKYQVGRRLALQALAHVYGLLPLSEAFGPLFRQARRQGESLILSFDYAQDGLVSSLDEIPGFELAGPEGTYRPARARIQGSEICLTSPAVPAPEKARYLWTDYGPVALFGRNGLPMAPFCTP